MVRSFLLFVALATTAIARPTTAQDGGGDAGDAALADRAGRWRVTETVWARPGSAPATSTGLLAERHIVGSYLQETLTAAEGGTAGPLRIDYLGFDQVAGRWDYLSLDTRASVPLMPAWSFDRGDPRRIVVQFAPFALPPSSASSVGPMLRMRQVISHDGADHDTKDQFFILANGSGIEWLAHRYEYIRQH